MPTVTTAAIVEAFGYECCSARRWSANLGLGKQDFSQEPPFTIIKLVQEGDPTSVATYIQNFSEKALDVQARQ